MIMDPNRIVREDPAGRMSAEDYTSYMERLMEVVALRTPEQVSIDIDHMMDLASQSPLMLFEFLLARAARAFATEEECGELARLAHGNHYTKECDDCEARSKCWPKKSDLHRSQLSEEQEERVTPIPARIAMALKGMTLN